MAESNNFNMTRREMMKGTAGAVALTLSSGIIETIAGVATDPVGLSHPICH